MTEALGSRIIITWERINIIIITWERIIITWARINITWERINIIIITWERINITWERINITRELSNNFLFYFSILAFQGFRRAGNPSTIDLICRGLIK